MTSSASGGHLVVIGASAGGSEALRALLAALPASFPVPVIVVRHLASGTGPSMMKALARQMELECREAEEGMKVEPGSVYFAPSDSHTLVQGDILHLTYGPAENRWRPSIDVLFRSAAVSYRSGVIGILLSGYLSDGAVGLGAIKKCGGVTIVQNPDSAEQPDMPWNALVHVSPDHSLAVEEMRPLLLQLAQSPLPPCPPIPKEVALEAEIACRAVGRISEVEKWGQRSPISCPDCGGVLWGVADGNALRYRCHVGHAFESLPLLTAQSAEIEKSLWAALRMFDERKVLLRGMAARQGASESIQQSIAEIEEHVRSLRQILHAGTLVRHGVEPNRQ